MPKWKTPAIRLRIQWRGLRTKIIAWSFVPTAIILVGVALVTFTAYERVTEDLVIQRDQEVIRLEAGQLASALAKYVDLLDTEGRAAAIYGERSLGQYLGRQRVAERLVVFDGGVLILDSHGVIVAAHPEEPEALGQDWSDDATFRQLLRASGPAFSDITADGPGGAEVIAVAVPITGPQGEFVGAMVGRFRLGTTSVSAFYGDLVKLRLGDSGHAYLVDGQGRVIYHSEAGHTGEDFSSQAVVQRVLGGEVSALRTRDPGGREIVAGFAPVPGTAWGLVTQESWGTLIQAGQAYRQFLIVLLALGVVIPALVVAIGVRRITQPIAELIRAAQEIAGGHFSGRITIRTRDEIQELAEQFNLMAGQLQASYAHLEQRVAARTQELATLNAIATTVSQSLDLSSVLHEALDKTLEVMGVEAGGIYLLDEAPGLLTVAAQQGFTPSFIAAIDRLRIGEGFSGQVVQSGQPLVVHDLSTDPRLTRSAVREEGLRAVAIVPLSSKGKALGTLFAAARGYRDFSGQDVQLLTSIGHQIGVAVENTRLFAAEQRQRREATLLADMARIVSGTLDLGEVLRLTATYAVDVFDVQCCCIMLYDEGKGVLTPAVTIGSDGQRVMALSGATLTPGERMRQVVFESLQPLIVEDVPAEPYLTPRGFLDLQSALVVPIEVGGRRLGAMQLGTHGPEPRRFATQEGALAMAMANQAAMAIDNARLFHAEQRRAEQFRLINEVGNRIASILAVDELLEGITHLLKASLGYYLVGIALIEDHELVFQAGAGGVWERTGFQPPRLRVGEEGITGWVAYSGESMLVNDVLREPRYYGLPESGEIRSEMAVPLKAKDAVIGVLHAQSDRPDAFDQSDLAVLQALAHEAAITIENARLYAQAQQAAVLEERNRLARELHDSVTQTLFSMSLTAQAACTLLERDPQRAIPQVFRLQELSRGALAEMRALIFQLRPAAVEEEGLVPALRKLAAALKNRDGLEVEVRTEGDGPLSPSEGRGLFRIAQEALNNVVKHSQADRAEVFLRVEAQRVELEIEDQGVGFSPEALDPGQSTLGMASMRERAELLGGRCTVTSRPGEGTRITVEINRAEGDTGHGSDQRPHRG